MLVAGGRGERATIAGTTLPKQFRPLGGRAVVARSYDLLVDAGCGPVVVVVPHELLDLTREVIGADVTVAAGGDVRAASVAAGLALVESETVVVHDAARPFASPDLVRAVVAALRDADGAIAAVPVEETLKRVDGDRIVETVARAGIWRAQTPQAFRTEALRAAHAEAAAQGIDATDDAQLLERMGRRVAVVPGSRSNVKITFAEDFALAEALLRAGGG